MAQRVALQSATYLQQRCMVVTQTNEQAFDLTRRLVANAAGLSIYMFAKEGLNLPDDLRREARLRMVQRTGDLPQTPSITIGNAAKWSWIDTADPMFDMQIVDESFQLPDYKYQLISNLAPRHALIVNGGAKAGHWGGVKVGQLRCS